MLRPSNVAFIRLAVLSMPAALQPLLAAKATADDARTSQIAWRETWVGADASAQSWSLYSGTTVSPFGGLAEDGFRLRTVAGAGSYSYSGVRWTGIAAERVTFHGRSTFADMLVGWQQGIGPATVKVFLGLAADGHEITPYDEANPAQGVAYGLKGQIETWFNLGDAAWLSVDGSVTSVRHAYWSRARLGWRVVPAVSVGLEAGASGHTAIDIRRAGLFVRTEWSFGELSASGGVADDGTGSADGYGTVNVLIKY